MIKLIKIVFESFNQALQSLLQNKLRSFLSLLGICIGIFCVIGVLSVVDSLKNNIMTSIDELGKDVIYVNKFSWTEDPVKDYWKWMKRKEPSINDYQAVKDKVETAKLVGLNTRIGKKLIKYRSTNVNGVNLACITENSGELMGLKLEQGRYFSRKEFATGSQKIILGHDIAKELFGSIPAIGKKIKVGNRKLEVIGVLKKSGESLIDFFYWDESALVVYNLGKRYVNLKVGHRYGSTIMVKPKEGINNNDLKEDIRITLRKEHRLKPKEKDDFSLNEVSFLTKMFNELFKVLNVAGGIIGMFALFIGIFSVANIMFVSVKERTNIIGIKKAIGAKKYVILIEFLMESILLCFIGGLLGMGLIYLTLVGISEIFHFDLFLGLNNIIIGISISFLTGIIAGVVPAIRASGLDPVVAIRSK